MPYGNQITLGTAVAQSLPDKRIIKLSQKQMQTLKTATEVTLAVVAAAGVVSVSVVAPNLFSAMGHFLPKGKKYSGYSHKQKAKKVAETFYYLKRTGLVRFRQSGTDWLLSLTDLGRRRLPKLEVDSLSVTKPKKWDGSWWVVAADIPTKDCRQGADLLRRKLKQLGFYPLQRTLWLYPFDPRREIEFISQAFGIARFVTVMKIAELDTQDLAVLKPYFKKLNLL
ncbi:MAG: hypothetical protein M1383_01800 [Patescibacteria group bacterium]|nr:hypothetical protein [Patescibacteria group bacterium]